MRTSLQYFRTHVYGRANIVNDVILLMSDAETEISNFSLHLFPQKYVLSFEIAMNECFFFEFNQPHAYLLD
jgi:hypothetical protein